MPMAPRPVDARERFETPENVWFDVRLAGPAVRMGAYLIDFLLRLLAFFVALIIVGIFITDSQTARGFAEGFTIVSLFALEWCYPWFFEAFRSGRTPGKSVLGIRVVRVGGYPLGFREAMLRNLLRAVDSLPFGYGIGLVTTLATRRFQRLGDILAGTIVIRDEQARRRVPFLASRPAEPLSIAERTSGWRPPERVIVLLERFARTRAKLHPARAEEIARALAAPLAERLGADLSFVEPAVASRSRRGSESEGSQEATRFLLRVLATYSDARATVADAPAAGMAGRYAAWTEGSASGPPPSVASTESYASGASIWKESRS